MPKDYNDTEIEVGNTVEVLGVHPKNEYYSSGSIGIVTHIGKEGIVVNFYAGSEFLILPNGYSKWAVDPSCVALAPDL